jgi:hypothetical protein
VPGTRSFAGRCHCGNVELAFETPTPPEELATRACACSFCRRHGVRTVSDPEGRARLLVRDPTRLNRYRFGLRTADFLVCRNCGVYVGAVYMDEEAATYAVLNLNTFDAPGDFPRQPQAVDYGHESEAERRSRRKANWTPIQVSMPGGSPSLTSTVQDPG